MILDMLHSMTGLQIFSSRIFAGGLALFFSFILSMILFPIYIKKLQELHFSSEISVDKHQPVMPAGILFTFVVVITTILTSRFNNFVVSALFVYIVYSIIGAVDDIAKIINKRKLLRNEISAKEYQYKTDGISASLRLTLYIVVAAIVAIFSYKFNPTMGNEVTFPFLSITKHLPVLPVLLFIPLMTIVIAVMANGVNFTDGFDTLSSVPILTNLTFIGIIAYVSSRPDWSNWFLIPQIQGINEILPLVGASIGVLLAFLWFNAPPSTIIMGDSGSIALGGLIGILFVFIKAEFYLPIVAFVFIVEFLSSFLQIFWYKLTKKRIFRCAPIHHHFQFIMRDSKNYSKESDIKSKLTWRFHITSTVLLIVGLILFLKVR